MVRTPHAHDSEPVVARTRGKHAKNVAFSQLEIGIIHTRKYFTFFWNTK